LDGNNHIFLNDSVANTVGEYDATTGATINATFINGQGLKDPAFMLLDGDNHFFIGNLGNNTIGEYNG
jgi:hypothetical protein